MKSLPSRSRDGLSVTRKTNEAIVFKLPSGEQIVVRLHKVGPSRATIHCVAPSSVTILREELTHKNSPEAQEALEVLKQIARLNQQ